MTVSLTGSGALRDVGAQRPGFTQLQIAFLEGPVWQPCEGTLCPEGQGRVSGPL